jgi:CRISPR-associated protein Csd2
MSELKHRYDFVLLFDVKDGNPNGDPDAGNLPRVDPETSHGLVSDVCLKRKVRNFIQLARDGVQGYDIYVKEKSVLSQQQGLAYKALGLEAPAAAAEEEEGEGEEAAKAEEGGKKKGGKKSTKSTKKASDGEVVLKAREWMCKNFFDIRAFGAVMSLKENNAGQVRGPVQLTFARSVEPVISLEHAITRMAVATQKEADQQGGDNRTMGRKMTVPYGLYRAHGFISPSLAKQTHFTTEDLELLWQALGSMFEHDRSAARGLMSTQRLLVFEHESELGSAPAHRLFDLVKVVRKDTSRPARDFSDYEVTLGATPGGVRLVERSV